MTHSILKAAWRSAVCALAFAVTSTASAETLESWIQTLPTRYTQFKHTKNLEEADYRDVMDEALDLLHSFAARLRSTVETIPLKKAQAEIDRDLAALARYERFFQDRTGWGGSAGTGSAISVMIYGLENEISATVSLLHIREEIKLDLSEWHAAWFKACEREN